MLDQAFQGSERASSSNLFLKNDAVITEASQLRLDFDGSHD